MKNIIYTFCLCAAIMIAYVPDCLVEDHVPTGVNPILEESDKDSGHRDLTGVPAGEARTYRDSGLIITVIKLPDEMSGHKTFEVTVTNQNAIKKSLNGRICLFDLRIRQAECGSGECPVYMEVPPKSKVTKKWDCREKSFFSAWTFVIVRVYDY
ncbi:MAG: hypothetical protein JXA07_13985 [Spirochaetes bacterium]|nr:hypothetical protein [Spirochaetota bacterium]